VSAVGVPPQWAVDKLHKAGILVMNVGGLIASVTGSGAHDWLSDHWTS
jgi:hypothetical protein